MKADADSISMNEPYFVALRLPRAPSPGPVAGLLDDAGVSCGDVGEVPLVVLAVARHRWAALSAPFVAAGGDARPTAAGVEMRIPNGGLGILLTDRAPEKETPHPTDVALDHVAIGVDHHSHAPVLTALSVLGDLAEPPHLEPPEGFPALDRMLAGTVALPAVRPYPLDTFYFVVVAPPVSGSDGQVSRFLSTCGPGLHHVAVAVDDERHDPLTEALTETLGAPSSVADASWRLRQTFFPRQPDGSMLELLVRHAPGFDSLNVAALVGGLATTF